MQYIDINTSTAKIRDLLKSLGWITNEKITGIEVPGEGNMNVVLRVKTDQRSFILKQSRPFVQKYPDLPAPAERIDVEYRFSKATAEVIGDHAPTILHYNPVQYLMMMEDLGDCEDMVSIYAQRSIDDGEVKQLVVLAESIHNQSAPDDYPLNMELRQLNHQHIFVLPFMIDNGFQLDEVQIGLQELSMIYKKDDELKAQIKQLGAHYLSKGTDLIHGDYYPGSWMKANDELYVIDAEFSFIGFKEFDLGVMVGHLILTTSDVGFIDRVCGYYNSKINKRLVSQIAGVEIMRRLIGLAQLPLDRTLEEKSNLLSKARGLILD